MKARPKNLKIIIDMLFSSIIFLFQFLPLCLLLYFLAGKRLRNLLLLIASLVFYAWGESYYVLLMLVSILVNYLCGLMIDRYRGRQAARGFLIAAIAFNVLSISVFKYANFLVDNLNTLLSQVGVGPIELAPIHLPIGISFFTFQAMSYVVDVYRRDASAQRNPLNIGLYIALFPQLIAGPIIRYHDIAAQLIRRRVRLDDFSYGIERFVVGLGKKVLIANQVAIIADQVFSVPYETLTPGVAWLGVLCYTLQIYFDFSGYSDMAIGLGRMFGFHFLENFNYPYFSRSIREFWRRWHISLSSWFRDYLYIPLGGNHAGPLRTYLNLLIVFFLCGLWHGASWNFVIWGLLHGLFLVIERLGFEKILNRCWSPLRHLYVMLVVCTGWVFFRTENLSAAIHYLAAMAGLNPSLDLQQQPFVQVDFYIRLAIAAGILFSTPVLRPLRGSIEGIIGIGRPKAADVLSGSIGILNTLALAVLFYASVLFLAAGAYNPFIYFRF
jgi:alginate O-acetyltransferase complex protein AlgI